MIICLYIKIKYTEIMVYKCSECEKRATYVRSDTQKKLCKECKQKYSDVERGGEGIRKGD